MQRLIFEPKSLREIPSEMLALKESFAPESLLANADNPAFFPYLISDERGPIGWTLLIFDGLYNVVCVDTLAVLPERRSIGMLHAIANHVFPLARAIGEMIGAKKIVTAMRGARAMTRWFPELRVIHTTVGMDLHPAAEAR